jgi:hypothetical protein
MKKFTLRISTLLMFLFMGTYLMAQMPAAITITPDNATAWDELTLTLDARLACYENAPLFDVDSVMMHSGVTIDGNVWQNVVAFDGLGVNGQAPKFTSNGDSTWSMTFVPAEFYGLEEGTLVTAINCVFNAGDWAVADGRDFDPDNPEACTDFFIPLGNVGIHESNISSFTMYPNPVENELTIENMENVNMIEVFNIIGEKVITVDVSTTAVTINTSNLNSGVYFVAFHNESGVQTTKFIKN